MLLNSPYSLHYAFVRPWSRHPDSIHQIIHDGPDLHRIAAIYGLQKFAFAGHVKRCRLDLRAAYPDDSVAQAIAQQAETAQELLNGCVVVEDAFTGTFAVYANGCSR